jgi:hypothetical protein
MDEGILDIPLPELEPARRGREVGVDLVIGSPKIGSPRPEDPADTPEVGAAGLDLDA